MPIVLQAHNFSMNGLAGVLDSRVPTGIPANRNPTWSSIPDQARTAGTTFAINAYASDPDGDSLTFSRTGGTAPVGVTVSSAGSVAILTNVAGGSYTVTVQASDGRGGTASATFNIAVTAAASGFTAEPGYSVSGTLADGQIITISGSGFGTKPNGAKPWLYLPHGSDLNPDTNYSRGTAANVSGTGLSFTAGTFPANGAGSLRCLMNSSSNAPGWTLSGAADLYVFSHRKFGYDVLKDAIASNIKTFRMYTNIAGPYPPNVSIYVSYTTGSITTISALTTVESIPDGAGDNAVYWGSVDARARLNELGTDWHTTEYDFKRSSSSGVADGILNHYVNGAKVGPAEALTTYNATRTANLITKVFFTQISSNVEPADYFYYGPTLIDDSRCRVIISSEASYNNSSAATTAVRDFCVPTAWADDSISLLLRQGIHSSLSGKHLYVVKSDGTSLKIGTFN